MKRNENKNSMQNKRGFCAELNQLRQNLCGCFGPSIDLNENLLNIIIIRNIDERVCLWECLKEREIDKKSMKE